MRRRALLAASQTGGGNRYILSVGPQQTTEVLDYLYNKYGVCGSVYNPIMISEAIYLEGFNDYTGLDGRVTRLYVPSSDSVWLYTEDSFSRYYAAILSVTSGEPYLGQHFFD